MGRQIELDGRLVDAESLLRSLDRADCEESLYTFLQYAWRYIDASPFTPGWPLEAVCAHLEAVADGEIKRLIINIPPRCAKSSITSVCFPAWVWAQPLITPTSGPGVPFLTGSYAEKLALRDSVKSRRLIESPWYQSMWSDRFQLTSDQNTKSRYENDKNGTRLITAVDAGVTGEGGNIIIIDDPNSAQKAFSEAAIQTTIEWWDQAMPTRLNDPKTGAFIIIQQRLSEEDLTGYILEKTADDWTHLVLPMRYEPERSFHTSIGWKDPRTEAGELLWDERFGEREVAMLEGQLGPWGAAGQLQQRPEPKGGGIIKRDWWQLWDNSVKNEAGDIVRPAVYPAMDFIVASLDTAYTTKTENDPSAMTVFGVFEGNMKAQNSKSGVGGGIIRTYSQQPPRAMMMFAWQERLELHELVIKVVETCRVMRVDKLLIENKAAGHSVAQELRRLFSHERFAVQLVDPKGSDKLARLYSIQHIFAEAMVYAPDKQWAEMVMAQVGTFPRGKHDDLVDTVSMCLRHLRDLGLLTRAPEMQADIEQSLRHTGRLPPPLYGAP